MKRKLDDEEYQALLSMFGKETAKLRSIRVQSKLFKYAFYFINIFSCAILVFFLLISTVNKYEMNYGLANFGCPEVPIRRAIVYFWLLSALNLSFYFGIAFRFVASIGLIYVLNASIDRLLVMYFSDFYADAQGLLLLAVSRPLVIIALAIVITKYRDE